MGVYAKRAFLHTSDRFLAGLYAEWPVLHTSGWFLAGLYAGMACFAYGSGKAGQ